MIYKIEDFQAPELDVYARRTENQLRNREHPEQGLFIAESPKVIERALQGGCSPVSFLMEEGKTDPILESFPQIPVYCAGFDCLKNLTGFPLTRGMLCAMKRPPRPSAEEICRRGRRIVILENVMNPTNVGAIFRSAAALNMDGVLLTPGCADPLYRRASRVSMGTVFQIPWTYLDTPWPGEGLSLIRQLGYRTAAMALRQDSVTLRNPMLRQEKKLAILMGTEGDGLGCSTIEGCDYTVRIPMTHGVDSLNVAAASAVAFYELGYEEA